MDLDFEGYPAFSHRISHRYVETSGDLEALRLLGFYKSYRAYVRGKVAGFAIDEPEVTEQDKVAACESARHYFELALAYLEPPPRPALIITVGLMGSGKSFLAEALGKRLGVTPIRADILRKEIHGVYPLQPQREGYRQGIYSLESTSRTYRAMLETARTRLHRGEPVILDASFIRRKHRSIALKVAQQTGARFRILHCQCPEAEAKDRLYTRLGRYGEPSDGRWELYHEQKAAIGNLMWYLVRLRSCRTGPQDRRGNLGNEGRAGVDAGFRLKGPDIFNSKPMPLWGGRININFQDV